MFVGLTVRKILHDVCPINRPDGLVTLIFDLLTLKPVYESHLRWGTFLPNLGTLGLSVLELFAMNATDVHKTERRTDGQKQRLLPLPYGQGHT